MDAFILILNDRAWMAEDDKDEIDIIEVFKGENASESGWILILVCFIQMWYMKDVFDWREMRKEKFTWQIARFRKVVIWELLR